MKEEFGNIWYFSGWKVIPTNGFVKKNGECVMGAGLARQAKERYHQFPLELGGWIKLYGNHTFIWPKYKLISFPVKHAWYNKTADIKLIARSAMELQSFPAELIDKACLPRVGCGNGQLSWSLVKPVLARFLDNRFTVVTLDLER